MQKKILLGFDLEEFDIPEEHGQKLPLETKLEVTYRGLQLVQDLISSHHISVTFFTTAFWASKFPAKINELAQNHEIASHSYFHNSFKEEDLSSSRQKLQQISGQEIYGLRMPRMNAVDLKAIADAGYLYDSSLHPTWIPGRYNNLRKQRTIFKENNIYELPASVTPFFRIPVFWLAFKNFNFKFYKYLCSRVLAKTDYLILYLHPWEYADLGSFKLSSMIKRIDGQLLVERTEKLITFLKKLGEFQTHFEFVDSLRAQ